MNLASNITFKSPISDKTGWQNHFCVDWIGTFLVFILYAGNRVPDVNEPHYWTKAAHFWNPDFGRGDLFLESGDVHWAFYLAFGWLTKFWTMEQAVWIARLCTWGLLSIGWTSMLHSLFSRTNGYGKLTKTHIPFLSTLVAPIWLAGMHWGLWAGEWVVGGCESKCIAYAFFFMGLGELAKRSFNVGWLCIGLGSMFHVVTGLWVIATCGVALLWIDLVWNRGSVWPWIRGQLAGWVLCIAGFLAGAIPAIRMDIRTASDDTTLSAVHQVYTRLGHHLSPIKFSESRWSGFLHLLAITVMVILLVRRQRTFWSSDESDQKHQKHWLRDAPPVFQLLMMTAWMAFVVAVFGLVFDLVFSNYAPRFAAKILRFYWFRWNDVMLPLALALVAVGVSTGVLQFANHAFRKRSLVLIGSLVASVAIIWFRHQENSNEKIPVGEKLNFVLKSDTPSAQIQQFSDWKRVCDWIKIETKADQLWLTPRRQQSFKWRTSRAELASWKDMPQNAASVVEWNGRIKSSYQYDKQKNLVPITTEKLEELRSKYGIHYVLLDLRVKGQTIPGWPLLYPRAPDSNSSFAVLESPTSSATQSPLAPQEKLEVEKQ
jgi:hypothetical protein